MANSDSINSHAIEYGDFTWNMLNDVGCALSILSGAKSLLRNSEKFDEDVDLISVSNLLAVLGEKIDGLRVAIDEHTYAYTLKPTE